MIPVVAEGGGSDGPFCAYNSLRLSRAPPEHIADNRVPKRLPEDLETEEGGSHGTCFQTLHALRAPIHIREAQPQGKFVQRQPERDAKDDRNPEVPPRITGRERGKPRDHQQENAPEQMMNVE